MVREEVGRDVEQKGEMRRGNEESSGKKALKGLRMTS